MPTERFELPLPGYKTGTLPIKQNRQTYYTYKYNSI